MEITSQGWVLGVIIREKIQRMYGINLGKWREGESSQHDARLANMRMETWSLEAHAFKSFPEQKARIYTQSCVSLHYTLTRYLGEVSSFKILYIDPVIKENFHQRYPSSLLGFSSIQSFEKVKTLYETALLDTYNIKAKVSMAHKNYPEITNEALPSL